MNKPYSPLELTRKLLRYNTVNPPGNERDCAAFLGHLLEEARYKVTLHEYAEKRACLVARLGGGNEVAPVCFSGHIDTVPPGSAAWAHDPFGGELEGDQLYGRGASDMKSGLAAMVHAALKIAGLPHRKTGITLVLTAGEENGCEGAKFLAQKPDILGKPVRSLSESRPRISRCWDIKAHFGWMPARTVSQRMVRCQSRAKVPFIKRPGP